MGLLDRASDFNVRNIGSDFSKRLLEAVDAFLERRQGDGHVLAFKMVGAGIVVLDRFMKEGSELLIKFDDTSF